MSVSVTLDGIVPMSDGNPYLRYGRRAGDLTPEQKAKLPYPKSCKDCLNAPPRTRVYASVTAKLGLVVGALTLAGAVSTAVYAGLHGAFQAGDYYRTQAQVADEVKQIAQTVRGHDEAIRRIELNVQRLTDAILPAHYDGKPSK
jgi:hypothetical protein